MGTQIARSRRLPHDFHWNFERVAQEAQGNWLWILSQLGIDAQYLRNRHGPCPGCAGRDRFRYDDNHGRGTWICGGGGHEQAGDGFQLLEHVYGWSHAESLKAVADVLGLSSEKFSHPLRKMPIINRIQNDEDRTQHQQKAAERARRIIKSATSAKTSHPYLLRKRLVDAAEHSSSRPFSTLFQLTVDKLVPLIGYHPKSGDKPLEGDVLIAPVGDWNGITTLEFIDGQGHKSALRRGRKTDCWWPTTQPMPEAEGTDHLLIGEGVATVLSVAMATGWPGVATLSCGNLLKVAKAMRYRYPQAKIVILADIGNGQTKAEKAARAIGGVLAIPDFGPDRREDQTDFNDLYCLVGSETLRKQIEETVARAQSAKPKISLVDDEGKKKSQATLLIELSAYLDYIVNPEGDVFAAIQHPTYREILAVRSAEFREWLSQSFFDLTTKGCNRNSLADALNTIEARAKARCKERQQVFLRVANLGHVIYIDLADEKWRVIEITSQGWRILDRSPVPFIRKRGMTALPEPMTDMTDEQGIVPSGKRISRLRRYLNLDDKYFPLMVGWLLAALGGAKPFPVLVLQGEQGAGKSAASRVIRALVDPSTAPLRSPPREVRDLLVSAVNSHVVALDNVSGLNPELSDALCRLSTGGAIDVRQLYTDLEQVLVELQRPVICNGIDDIATRPDLALNRPGF